MNTSGQGCHRLRGALVGFGYIMENGHAAAYRQLAALDALDAGLHVLCEKPLAWSTEQAASMLRRAVAQFKTAIERTDCVGVEALEAFRCVQLIQMGYLSASKDSRRVLVPGPAVLAATRACWRRRSSRSWPSFAGQLFS
jgi:hypothetical protein